jgi:hypothetical protein
MSEMFCQGQFRNTTSTAFEFCASSYSMKKYVYVQNINQKIKVFLIFQLKKSNMEKRFVVRDKATIREHPHFILVDSVAPKGKDKRKCHFFVLTLLESSFKISKLIKIEFEDYPFTFPVISIGERRFENLLVDLSTFFKHQPFCMCCNFKCVKDYWGPTLNIKYILDEIKQVYEIVDDLIIALPVIQILKKYFGCYLPIHEFITKSKAVSIYIQNLFL